MSDAAIDTVACRVTTIVEEADRHIGVGDVIDAHLRHLPSGPETVSPAMKDLRDNVFYGG